jgi:hypothetical protein
MKRILFTLFALSIVLTACASGPGLFGGNSTPTATVVASATPGCPPDYTVMADGGCQLATQVAPATATNMPAPTSAPATSTNVPAATNAPVVNTTGDCTFSAPSTDFDSMPKTLIELAEMNKWFHRVYNPREFNAAHNWGGADSWFNTYALGPNSGGAWTSYGNPGEFVYRATSTHVNWCLGVHTNSQYKDQFLGNQASLSAAINIRVAHDVDVYVQTASGKVVVQKTSDQGDITVVLPDNGTVFIWTDFSTAAPTFESKVWVGPYDRSEFINTIRADQ